MVAVAVIDCPSGTVLFAKKSLTETVPLVFVVAVVSPRKVFPLADVARVGVEPDQELRAGDGVQERVDPGFAGARGSRRDSDRREVLQVARACVRVVRRAAVVSVGSVAVGTEAVAVISSP